jgi:hypothetical protein
LVRNTALAIIKDGLDAGEKGFHIVDPDRRDDHLKRLTQAGINVEKAIATGQLEVRAWQESYLRGDRFDQDAMLALVDENGEAKIIIELVKAPKR